MRIHDQENDREAIDHMLSKAWLPEPKIYRDKDHMHGRTVRATMEQGARRKTNNRQSDVNNLPFNDLRVNIIRSYMGLVWALSLSGLPECRRLKYGCSRGLNLVKLGGQRIWSDNRKLLFTHV